MGLKKGDLRDLVYDIFEIDSFSSKMGSDKDIVTLSFSVKERNAADDLMQFLERGYNYILDADVTPGQQSDGTYKVFVEMERNTDVIGNILDVVDGVKSLSDVDGFRFRYYKNFRSRDADEESLQEMVPVDPDNYGVVTNETSLNNYKNFFNKSYLENVDMLEDTIILKRKYADPIAFEFVDFGDIRTINENIEGPLDLMNSYPEVLFLTKYLGDYNISKYGDKLVFENNDAALVVKRISG
jgi:hypothetical protein